jgi:hypothetical protein
MASGFNQAGFDQASKGFMAGSYLSGAKDPYALPGIKTGVTGVNPLFQSGALTTKAPNPNDYMTAAVQLQSLVGPKTTVVPHPAAGVK